MQLWLQWREHFDFGMRRMDVIWKMLLWLQCRVHFLRQPFESSQFHCVFHYFWHAVSRGTIPIVVSHTRLPRQIGSQRFPKTNSAATSSCRLRKYFFKFRNVHATAARATSLKCKGSLTETFARNMAPLVLQTTINVMKSTHPKIDLQRTEVQQIS